MLGNNGDTQVSDQHLHIHQKTYERGKGIKRYKNSLKNHIPFRRKKKDTGTMAIDNAGLFSFISMSWMTKFMYEAHSKGLKIEELPSVSPYDACDYNADRLELLWNEELAERGPKRASLSRVAWRFCRTRIFASGLVETCNVACGILSNTIFMRMLLESLQSGGSYQDGVKWALLLTAAESARALFWAWSWAMNYRTALRLRSACLTLVYRKIIGVNNLGKQDVGEVINIFSNDALRIFEMMYFGPLIIQAPISTVCGVLYILYLFGPMALIGMVVFILYYPLQYAISQLIGYRRLGGRRSQLGKPVKKILTRPTREEHPNSANP